ncbi:hypothetical protein UO65_6424 [Actinokineospora spheciospongiae]|uniref:Uncharacterized protein n=1 Tax=Actinokineospora spheciospongiae TaxID=909613 RepID=W7INE6_9PSEU|nr:hypothetical protein UO65_6424 [Actinokineospora spheciospongiae]
MPACPAGAPLARGPALCVRPTGRAALAYPGAFKQVRARQGTSRAAVVIMVPQIVHPWAAAAKIVRRTVTSPP